MARTQPADQPFGQPRGGQGLPLPLELVAQLVGGTVGDEQQGPHGLRDEYLTLSLRGEEPQYPEESDSVKRANTMFRIFRWFPVIALIVGVGCLLYFAALNLGLTHHGPWWRFWQYPRSKGQECLRA